jgi:hypothetical protein
MHSSHHNREEPSAPTIALEPAQTLSHPSPDLICPKCGHRQEHAPECRRCGVIFARLRNWHSSEPSLAAHRLSLNAYETSRRRNQLVILAMLLIALGFLGHHRWAARAVQHPPGILVPGEPQQSIIHNPRPWKFGERVIVPLARFRLQARVLSTERYRLDSTADLSPIDLALGWGLMSDQRVVDQLNIVQGNRCYVLTPVHPAPPLPWSVIMVHSANMHMIPADRDIKSRLIALRAGEIIELSGYLVGVQENGRWCWVSSLKRTDTGDGSCEIVWVESLTTHPASTARPDS